MTAKKNESSSVMLVRHLTAFGMLVFYTNSKKLLVFLVLFLIGLKSTCPKGDSDLSFQELFLIAYTSKLEFRKALL